MNLLQRLFVVTLLLAGSGGGVSAQTTTYGWDGGAGTSDWSSTVNWTDFFGPNPDINFGPPIPDTGTRVEIAIDGSGSVPAPVIDNETALMHQLRLGRTEGAGKLTITGGSLSTGSEVGTIKVRIGNGLPGTLVMSGGVLNVINGTMTTGDGVTTNTKGQITISGGALNITGANRDLNMDELVGSQAGSNLTMSAGTVSIADVLLVDNLASIDLSGGTITAAVEQAGAIRVRRSGEIRLTGGLLETKDDLELGNSSNEGGTVRIDGGIVRAFRLSDVGATASILINSTGLLQVNNTQSSVAALQSLITSGLIASSSPLTVSVVNVGGVNYSQVAAVVGVPGDYSGNGVVDAADYTVYRDTLGSTTMLAADGSGNGVIDTADYNFWSTRFGNTSSASFAAASAVAEPCSACGLVVAIGLVGGYLRRGDRSSITVNA